MIISLTGFMGCGKSSVGRRLSTLLSCSYMDLDEVVEKAAGRSIPEIFASDGEAVFRRMEAEELSAIIRQMPDSSRDSLHDMEVEQSLPSHAMAARCKSPLGCLPIARDLCGQRGITVPPSCHRGCIPSKVLSLGGGTVMTEVCARIVHEKTLCIYLRASVDTLVSHLEGETEGRPMLAADMPLRTRIAGLMDMRASTYEKTAHIIIDIDGKSVENICSEIIRTIG